MITQHPTPEAAPEATHLNGWAAPTEDPHLRHHFVHDSNRSRCGPRFLASGMSLGRPHAAIAVNGGVRASPDWVW